MEGEACIYTISPNSRHKCRFYNGLANSKRDLFLLASVCSSGFPHGSCECEPLPSCGNFYSDRLPMLSEGTTFKHISSSDLFQINKINSCCSFSSMCADTHAVIFLHFFPTLKLKLFLLVYNAISVLIIHLPLTW